MDPSSEIPDDLNGRVLRQMIDGGDDLSEPRIVDFCFIFPERRQALAFAELIDDSELKVCISYYEGREMWQAKVHRYMVPTHKQITSMEFELSERAESVGGEADGWGCMRIVQKT